MTEFYFIYSLTILAICKASNLFISRQDKMKIDKDNKWKRVLSKRDDKVCVCVCSNQPHAVAGC